MMVDVHDDLPVIYVRGSEHPTVTTGVDRNTVSILSQRTTVGADRSRSR